MLPVYVNVKSGYCESLPTRSKKEKDYYRYKNSQHLHVANFTDYVTVIQCVMCVNRGVFGQQFDPLVFENFSKLTTKRAKMTVKE